MSVKCGLAQTDPIDSDLIDFYDVKKIKKVNMANCINCGGNIVFRYINNKPTPIHTDSGNGWCKSSISQDKKKVEYSKFEDFCSQTKCPICEQKVFFIRHNGGSVWVDVLGKPWPIHTCFQNMAKSHSGWFISMQEKTKSFNKLISGVVISAKHKIPIIWVVISDENDDKYEISFKAFNQASFFESQFVVFDIDKKLITFERSDVLSFISILKITPSKFKKSAITLQKSKINYQELAKEISQLDSDIQSVLLSASYQALINKNFAFFLDILNAVNKFEHRAILMWIFLATGAGYLDGKFVSSDQYLESLFGTAKFGKDEILSHLRLMEQINWYELGI